MPVIKNIKVCLELNSIHRRLGNYQRRSTPVVNRLIEQLLKEVCVSKLMEPVIAYEFHEADTYRHLIGKTTEKNFQHSRFSLVLVSAKKIAAAVCSLGPCLEKRVAGYVSEKEVLKATVLDAIGSAAVDAMVSEVCRYIGRQARSLEYQVSSPVSPGMRAFPISELQPLLQLSGADRIGVAINPQQMMMPRKSVSMIVALGPKMPTWSRAEVCNRCKLIETCRYRISGS